MLIAVNSPPMVPAPHSTQSRSTAARSPIRSLPSRTAPAPTVSNAIGAAPMALLTVGAGAVLLGKDLIGERAAVDLDWVLWGGRHHRRAVHRDKHPVFD